MDGKKRLVDSSCKFPLLVCRQTKSQLQGQIGKVFIEVLFSPPRSNSHKHRNKRNIIYLAALLLGVLIPFGIIYLLLLLDTKIHSKQDFERLSPDIPVVAEIPFIEEEHRIITKNDRSVLAESFRILRTNIHYLIPLKKEEKCTVIYTVRNSWMSTDSIVLRRTIKNPLSLAACGFS